MSSWDILIFQRDLQSGVSLQTVSRAAGLTEDLQLDQFFTILQVRGKSLDHNIRSHTVCLSVYLFHPQLKHSYPLFPSLFSLLFLLLSSSSPPLLTFSLSSFLSFLPSSLLSSSSPFLLLIFHSLLSYLSLSQESVGLMGVLEGGTVKEGETGDVSKFLNRILGLKVHQQNLVRGVWQGCVAGGVAGV